MSLVAGPVTTSIRPVAWRPPTPWLAFELIEPPELRPGDWLPFTGIVQSVTFLGGGGDVDATFGYLASEWVQFADQWQLLWWLQGNGLTVRVLGGRRLLVGR